ncbi:hypothetical protein [Pseudogemmobacter sonorensis]|uniref:hypothetical protein n=1 Tax=Pseudogemmobacter sonorensis TaxID=2989681 RepID=UPI0036774B7D
MAATISISAGSKAAASPSPGGNWNAWSASGGICLRSGIVRRASLFGFPVWGADMTPEQATGALYFIK